jgi:hypothetical protein
VAQNYAGYSRWLTPERLVCVGQQFKLLSACHDPGCPLDTRISGTEVTLLDLSVKMATCTAVPGTGSA